MSTRSGLCTLTPGPVATETPTVTTTAKQHNGSIHDRTTQSAKPRPRKPVDARFEWPASPAQGDRYIVGPSPTGAWVGMTDKIAVYLDTTWSFFTPKAGWRARCNDTGGSLRHDGSAWGMADTYDLQVYRHRLPTDPLEPLLSLIIPRPVTFVGAYCTAKFPATGNCFFTLFRNSTSLGTVNFANADTVGHFTPTAPVTFQPNDVMEIFAPSPPNPTLGGVRLALVGTR